jgi:LPXTG-motif cell wall-anchored protein
MKLNRMSRGVALASGAGLAALPMAFAVTPSVAAADCGEGTEVSAGICEKAYTTAGDYTFAVPASVSKMSAVLVGGGASGGVGATEMAYAGGGGGVLFVDSVDISAPIALTVGAGSADPDIPAGDTTIGTNTAGGGGVLSLITSGSPQDSAGWNNGISLPGLGSGGGAGGTSTTCAAGPGLTASAAAAGSSLFPAVAGEPELGQGGSCSGITPLGAAGAGKGGDVYTSGAIFAADAGTDGAVVFRWAAASLPDDALPDTGMSVQPWMIGAGVAAVAAGALFASGVLRVRRQGRHSL